MTLYFSAYHIEPKKEDYPFTPFAHVCLQTHGQGKEGAILIGPQLMTPGEVDHHVDSLISDLEEVRKALKKKLAR
jgi:hypothetical protein